jgi:hypothetical protein
MGAHLGRYYYVVNRLNGDFGFEVDCESVGVECHVGPGSVVAKFRGTVG